KRNPHEQATKRCGYRTRHTTDADPCHVVEQNSFTIARTDAMAPTLVSQIDDLFSGRSAAPLSAANATADAVGVLQDLLTGHGYKGIPGILGTARGRFGPATAAAVSDFQRSRGLPDSGGVD